MRILFVDDTRDTRDMFSIAFRLKGHEAITASDGREAVDAMRSTHNHFDAIIMDVEMPIMNGWEAVQEIRALRNGGKIPIIMFTAYGDSEYHDRALNLGANDLWRKPLLPHEVLLRLESMMG